MLPFPHSSSGYKKLITPSGKKLVPLYPGFLMYPAFFDPTNDNKHFTTKQITVKKQSLPLMNMPGFRMSLISISLCRFYSTPKRQFLFLARNFRKKTTQKNSASLQSLVRISNARADAHNTIAPPPHIQDPVTKN